MDRPTKVGLAGRKLFIKKNEREAPVLVIQCSGPSSALEYDRERDRDKGERQRELDDDRPVHAGGDRKR